MKRYLLPLLHRVDRRMAAVSLRCRRERPALLTFALHSLFEDTREARSGTIDPFHPVLVSDLVRFIEYFADLGYRFVTPAQLVEGLDPGGHYVWITFDDGYANNLRALPVLSRFGVPATFFISAAHVTDGKAFWWDALYRARRRRGVTAASIRREQAALKRRPLREIEASLRADLGRGCLDPVGESDRPMTAAELAALAAMPLASLGNHTSDHAILTQCDDGEVRAQIRSCQQHLVAVAGGAPVAIAYPDGRADERVVRLARAEGLRLGVGMTRGKNILPLTDSTAMRIARHSVSPGPGLADHCLRCRSDVGLVPTLRRLTAQRF